MSRKWPCRVITALALAFAVNGAVLPAAPIRAEGVPGNWTTTPFGPLGPADRDLLVKVRLAGLWEMPAGDMAQHRAVNPKVKEVAAKISAEHHDLDEAVRAAAVQLAVDLPNEPNGDQKQWLNEMENANGTTFDRIFIDRLRAAHGKVFAVIAGVRAGTRNDVIRSFATTANAAVLRHMGYLESSGLVDWQALPVPPEPQTPAEVTRLAGLGTRSGHPILIWIVLAAAVIAGLSAAARAIRVR